MTGNTTRRPHKKTRTGCITCKVRRVKCSEERPACHRCIKSGRVCAGYAPDLTLAAPAPKREPGTGSTSSPFSLTPQNPLSPYFGGAMSPIELRSLQFFHDQTVPSLCGFFDSDLWQKLLLQASHSEPGLRHAMIAIGFQQKSVDLYGIPAIDSVEDPNNRLDRMDAFPLNQYMKAVGLIRQRLAGGDDRDGIVTLVACVLFVCLEFLRGERKAAYAHLKSGLEIIRSKIESASPDSQEKSLIPFRQNTIEANDLAPMFARMSFFTTLHRLPKSDPFIGILDLDIRKRDALDPFPTLAEARTASTNLNNLTIRFANKAILRAFPSDEAALAERQELRAALRDFSDALEPYLSRDKFDLHVPLDPHERGPAVLRVHALICEIWADVVRCPQDEWSYDLHLDAFKKMVWAIESVVDLTETVRHLDNCTTSNFTLDNGLITPLFFTAVKCRDPSTRRHAISVLYKVPRREAVWDALQSAKIAEIHVAVEEEQVAQPSNTNWPPMLSRIIDYDISLRDERNANRQVVVLRMVRRDGSEEPERRIQYLHYRNETSGPAMQRIPYSHREMKPVVEQDPISIFEGLNGWQIE